MCKAIEWWSLVDILRPKLIYTLIQKWAGCCKDDLWKKKNLSTLSLTLIFQYFTCLVHTQTYHAYAVVSVLNRSCLVFRIPWFPDIWKNSIAKGSGCIKHLSTYLHSMQSHSLFGAWVCLYWYFNNHLGKKKTSLKGSLLIFTELRILSADSKAKLWNALWNAVEFRNL